MVNPPSVVAPSFYEYVGLLDSAISDSSAILLSLDPPYIWSWPHPKGSCLSWKSSFSGLDPKWGGLGEKKIIFLKNPSTVLSQMNGLINGEMAQGILNNFLGWREGDESCLILTRVFCEEGEIFLYLFLKFFFDVMYIFLNFLNILLIFFNVPFCLILP